MHRWKLSALAAAAFVSVALAPTDAAALALGPIRIQSALGENLRAEIAIPQITAAEMNSLSVQIAAPEVFRAQGMDYSSAARSVQVSLQRNPDGTASLRLSSNTPINEPFVDLVIDSQWSTGNLVRTYTLLLDPPASQRRAAPAPTPAQVTPPVAAAPA
ncbi:type IV pilus assembly protein FimV, partial [Comamonas aquatica]